MGFGARGCLASPGRPAGCFAAVESVRFARFSPKTTALCVLSVFAPKCQNSVFCPKAQGSVCFAGFCPKTNTKQKAGFCPKVRALFVSRDFAPKQRLGKRLGFAPKVQALSVLRNSAPKPRQASAAAS
ncbi:protein ORFE7D [Equid gammaherpesvirus 5]|nr:protein ORFE7D [Equid gammaherpesvirus 5]